MVNNMAQQNYGEWMRSNPSIPNLTAVEWLIEQFETIVFYSEEAKENTIKQAQAMFEEQIMDAFNNGVNDECIGSNKTPEQYYNETFNK